jgi:replicative DNA helicase
MSLKSIQVEKHVLGGLIQNPQVFSDIERFVSEYDFTAEPHNVIFSCIKSFSLKNKKIDKVLLAQEIKNLGISFKDDINIFDYIDSISFTPITSDATIQACQELVKLRVLRDIDLVCQDIQNHVKKSVPQDLSKTITEIDGIYANKLNNYSIDIGEQHLFSGLSDLAEELGNNPIEEVGISTQFPEFNRLYGGLRPKNLYIIASRAKAGKSTLLSEISSEMSRIHKMPVLILDTEMSTREIQFRTIAAKSGVGLWYIETGNWRKNKEFTEKVRQALKTIDQEYNVDHYFIGNKKIEEVIAIARRWYLKKVKRGGKCLICFDYIKMMDKLSYNQQEYQLMGDKVDALKKLAEELDCPILTAVQSNRSGITNNREISELVDDESSIGISDRITWYASYVGILRRKVSEEIILDTPSSGTHKLIEAVSRWQGRDAAGHQDLILRKFPDKKTKYVKNYINLNFDNFRVEEKGSLKDSIIRQNAQFKIIDADKEEDTILE